MESHGRATEDGWKSLEPSLMPGPDWQIRAGGFDNPGGVSPTD